MSGSRSCIAPVAPHRKDSQAQERQAVPITPCCIELRLPFSRCSKPLTSLISQFSNQRTPCPQVTASPLRIVLSLPPHPALEPTTADVQLTNSLHRQLESSDSVELGGIWNVSPATNSQQSYLCASPIAPRSFVNSTLVSWSLSSCDSGSTRR